MPRLNDLIPVPADAHPDLTGTSNALMLSLLGNPPAIRFGDRGDEVIALQRALNAHGESLDVDGIFGPATLAAVIDFQSRSGLEPDGIVGRATRAALGLSA